MIEVQIRRPCSEPKPVKGREWAGGVGSLCPECGVESFRDDKRIEHVLAHVWVPLTCDSVTALLVYNSQHGKAAGKAARKPAGESRITGNEELLP